MAAYRMEKTIQRRLRHTKIPVEEETPNNLLAGCTGMGKRTEVDHLVAVNLLDLFSADPGAEGAPGREVRISVKIGVIDAIIVHATGREGEEHTPPVSVHRVKTTKANNVPETDGIVGKEPKTTGCIVDRQVAYPQRGRRFSIQANS